MNLENKKLFVVDDDKSVCRALSMLLGTYGFIVDSFTSAEDFFSAVTDSTDGCLILDIHMPGLGGWDALKIIISSGLWRPVIIISAKKNGGLKERVLKAGAVGYLQKPFNDLELVELIKVAFQKEEEHV